ncbi:hypothetical protein PHLCEN_2v1989, partial [Hermanssonia centrifuga]
AVRKIRAEMAHSAAGCPKSAQNGRLEAAHGRPKFRTFPDGLFGRFRGSWSLSAGPRFGC